MLHDDSYGIFRNEHNKHAKERKGRDCGILAKLVGDWVSSFTVRLSSSFFSIPGGQTGRRL